MHKDAPNEPHERLKGIRRRSGLTLRDVEALVEGQLSHGYIGRMEKDPDKLQGATIKALKALGNAYGLSIQEFLSYLFDWEPVDLSKADKAAYASMVKLRLMELEATIDSLSQELSGARDDLEALRLEVST